MTIFKCKMCGGSIEVKEGSSVGICDSCGTQQTLPRLDDERRANLYDRANHFRRNNEFDKAAGIYEKILNEDKSDAEAYWSLVLCRYGVEYVEDPATHKRVPTVNRTQFTSIFNDDDYKSALRYADGYQRSIYEKEANAINEIQKGILAVSRKEEPFDVFICYKETDHAGRRTPDSVLANDLYHHLTHEGFKVFFSRITLEDKLGTAYEPYIFAALNSAKVMVVLGTKPEYINAAWVKNEWNRYLALVKQSGGKKVLIPAYKDMDPYDLPEEFSHLQAQDMSKLGFMQDLIRGIKKITRTDEPKPIGVGTAAANAMGAGVKPLLKRVFIFLEDGNWEDADRYCERVLDQEPENAWAYFGKLMAELRIHRKGDLTAFQESFRDNKNYQKAVRYGGDKMRDLVRLDERNTKRIEQERLTRIYQGAVHEMNTADDESAFESAASIFKKISNFKDSDDLAMECLARAKDCRNKIEAHRKDVIYEAAKLQMERKVVVGWLNAIKIFQMISGWKDSNEQILLCKRKIVENKPHQYNSALDLLNNHDYMGAYRQLDGLNYKDSNYKLYELEKMLLASAREGSYVFFGSYPQDSSGFYDKEAIEWRVLKRKRNQILLLSKHTLGYKPYCVGVTGKRATRTWDVCSLRKWLNNDFFDFAFNPDEQNNVLDTLVKKPWLSKGVNTYDKVFLLDVSEAFKYLSSNELRKCTPRFNDIPCITPVDKENFTQWWLRTYDVYSMRLMSENARYSVVQQSFSSNCGVRPALWINAKLKMR